jgi:hypothetical protein
MPTENIPPKDRIALSFKNLATVSTDLNAAARELGVSIVSLENALESLHLGVSAWHEVAGNDVGDTYWTRDLGYTRIGEKWRIALRTTSGCRPADDYHEQVWPFNEAPRWMCVESVGELPDLFDTLIKRTVETTEKIKRKIADTEELAAAVRGIRSEVEAERKAAKAKQ